MLTDERKHVWIDQFQTRLALRIGAYLALLPLVLINLLFVWKLAAEGVNDPLAQLVSLLRDSLPIGVCLLILVPVMAWDAIRFSHRLVGPIARFRKSIQELARGEAVRPIKLRDGDYLTELRDEFNQMLEHLQRQGVPVLRPNVPSEPDKVAQQQA
jgi:methyl-accepting chemotaxis protein